MDRANVSNPSADERPDAADPVLYLAANPVEAQLLRDHLAGAGIEVEIRGAYAWGATGELPFAETYPRLHLRDPREWDRARALLRAYEQGAATQPQWRCHRCQELCPGTFEICWNCHGPRA